jgi:hypothetical protein
MNRKCTARRTFREVAKNTTRRPLVSLPSRHGWGELVSQDTDVV